MSLWASYAPGSWLAVAGPSSWALLELAHDDPRVGRARVAVAADDPVDELLDVLVAGGVRRLPGFAVVAEQYGTLRYVVRRPARVELDGRVVGADAAGTWVDGVVDRVPGRVVLALPSAPGGGERPLAAALVGASRLVLATAPQTPATRGLIDGVPWLGPPAHEPAAPAPAAPPTLRDALGSHRPAPVLPAPAPVPASAPAPVPDHDHGHGHTRRRGESEAPPSESGWPATPAPASAGVPIVWAIRCVGGHLTPPYSVTCRVCGAAVPDRPPVQVPRPVLGRVVLSTGGTMPLDRGILLGRSPRTVEAGTGRPHLVRLAESPEVSRTHAEIRLDGWQVLLRDLGSANGTTLTPPGGVVEQIRAHEDYVLEPGAVVSLADVVSLRYEVAP